MSEIRKTSSHAESAEKNGARASRPQICLTRRREAAKKNSVTPAGMTAHLCSAFDFFAPSRDMFILDSATPLRAAQNDGVLTSDL